MSSVTERPALRQTRQLAFIAKFTTDIRYVKGETNFVADAVQHGTNLATNSQHNANTVNLPNNSPLM